MAENRRAQLEELECLEAMYIDEFLLVTSADAVAALRAKCDLVGEDAASADAATLRDVAMHPPLEFSLQLTAHGERTAEAAPAPTDEAGAEQEGGAPSLAGPTSGGPTATPLVASLLLRVRFPATYPAAAPPVLILEDAMVTTEEPLASDKVLTTQALVQEEELLAAMLERAAETLPDPCVFDAASWAVENAFEFVRLGQGWV